VGEALPHNGASFPPRERTQPVNPEQTIVVVGHGAAGLTAAIAAAESSRDRGTAAHVLLVDAKPEGEHGGNTRWSPSYIRMKSPGELAPGFEDDLMAASAGRADAAYVRRLADGAVETVAWLQENGVSFHAPTYYLSAGPPRIQPVGGGRALLDALTHAARKLGVEMRFDTRAEALARSASGAVSHLTLRDAQDHLTTVPVGAVILACGGFAGDGPMMDAHFGAGAAAMRPISPGTPSNDGSGIRLALDAGARASGDWNGMHAEPVDARSTQSAPVVLVYPYGIVVDAAGRRFFDEGAGLVHETWEWFARRIHFELPGRVAFAILDSTLFDIAGYERALRTELPPLQADTLPALAKLAGIDADALAATVAAYNRAATGDRSRFDATRIDGLAAAAGLVPVKSNWARPIDRPPYLCWPLHGAIAYTFGGVATNPEAEVLADDGPIPGLYAAGEITGHFHGTAPNAVAMLRALVFGRIAGANAAGRLIRR